MKKKRLVVNKLKSGVPKTFQALVYEGSSNPNDPDFVAYLKVIKSAMGRKARTMLDDSL